MKKLGELIKIKKPENLGVSDVKYLVEEWLRRELREESVGVESVDGGSVVIRVPNALLAQEVYVREYDLGEELRAQGFELKRLRVIQRW